MTPFVEIVFVWVPVVAAVALVAHFARRCRKDGLTPIQILIDRRFMIVFFYTGALLAIYLSTFRFFYFGLR